MGLSVTGAPCLLVVIVVCTFNLAFAGDRTRRKMCPPQKWKCGSNDCIDTKFRCNGANNCNDGSDELNCEQWTCLANRWKCNNNRVCISLSSRCDGTDDCGDNSDEENCGNLRIDCPTYVMEKSNLTCECRTKTLDRPYTITWPGQSQSNTLTLTNVQRSDNGTQFTCRLTSDNVTEEAVYTLLVAYGPHEGQVSISPPYQVRNYTEPVTLTCNAQDTYPTPVYEWGGLPCLKREDGDNTCTFHPDPTYDNDNTAVCRAESVVLNSYQKLDDSVSGTATGRLKLNITFLSDCGGDFVANHTVQSFGVSRVSHRSTYPPNMYCVWRITAPVGEPLWLDFPYIWLERPGRCNKDYVKIYEGDEKTGRYDGRLCQRSWFRHMTMNGMFTVTFTSNYRFGKSGFRAAFKTVAGCYQNLTITNETTTLTSPNYPANYNNHLKCVWHLTAPEGTYIKFKFIDFVLQKSRGCRWDSLGFYDGPSEGGYRLGHYCGDKDRRRQSKYSAFTSISNTATLVFKTSHNRVAKGFKLEIKAKDTFKCPRLKPFQCDNLHCLPESYRCNGRDNCGDNSDEANCP